MPLSQPRDAKGVGVFTAVGGGGARAYIRFGSPVLWFYRDPQFYQREIFTLTIVSCDQCLIRNPEGYSLYKFEDGILFFE